jgi:hypothetical protein
MKPRRGKVSKALNSSVVKVVIATNQNEYKAPQLKLTINEIIEAEARASLVDAKLFTREAATKFKKGSREFINKLIEEQK